MENSTENSERVLTRTQKAREFFKNLAPTYDKIRETRIGRAERGIVYNYLSNFRGLKTLELGSGTGDYPVYIDPYNYTGIDNCKAMKLAAEARIKEKGISRCKFYQRDARFIDLRKERGRFSFIVSTFNSIGYTDDPESIADEIFEYLKPGGRFYLMLPGVKMLARKRLEDEGSPEILPYSDQMARHIFTRGGTMKVLSCFGLNIHGEKLAPYLPGLLLRIYLILEAVVGRWVFPSLINKAHYIILEGFKPLPLTERDQAKRQTVTETGAAIIKDLKQKAKA